MLLHSSSYFCTASKSKILTVGINLETEDVEVEIRSHSSKYGIVIPDFLVLETKFDLISDFFDGPDDSKDLYFSITKGNSTVFFAGRKRFKNKLLLIYTKDPTRPTKLFLAKATFFILKDMAGLINNRRFALTQEFKDVRRVAEVLAHTLTTRELPTDDDQLAISLSLIDPEVVALENNFNLDALKILYELILFCPNAVKKYIVKK
jgi:hypothetical protein